MTSSYQKISGFDRPHVSEMLSDSKISTLECGFKNFRIRLRIRRMRVDDSRIRKEKVSDSKISGYVWTGPRSCEGVSEAPSTRIRKFVKTQIFFCEYGLRPHVSSVFSGRIRKFLKTLSRVEIFLSDTNSYTCGRSYPQICEYAYVIFLNPVYTSSIINKHAVQQGCIFFVNCSDF